MSDRNMTERRRSARITLKGTVILLAPELAQRGRITNIGAGGLLASTAMTPSDQLLGTSVDLELRVDGQGSEWLRRAGRVARIEPNQVAIAFEKVPPTFARLIADLAKVSGAGGAR